MELAFQWRGQQLRAIYRLYEQNAMVARTFTLGSDSYERLGLGQFSCTECNNIFPTPLETEQHYRTDHPEVRETMTPRYRVVVAITQTEPEE